MKIESAEQIDALDFDKGGGLVPLIAQDVHSGEVRMIGYADRRALEASLQRGTLHFHSRRRGSLWQKGATSGNLLEVVSLHADCDRDAVLALVRPLGPTCHTGARSCFDAAPFLLQLADVIEERAGGEDESGSSYTARLLRDRNLRLKKLTEEAGELAVACADEDADAVAAETADLLYHALVACRAAGVRFEDVVELLRSRHS